LYQWLQRWRRTEIEMSLFLFTFCGIYGLMQYYLFRRVKLAFPGMAWWAAAPLIVFLALMIFLPIGVRMLERAGRHQTAMWLSAPGHAWLAIIVWFVSLGLVCDVWNLSVSALAKLMPAAGSLSIPPRAALAVVGFGVAAMAAWGVHEATAFRLEHVAVRLANLPPGFRPIRLVQISDLHLGMFMRENSLKRVVELVRQAQPDVLVSTGDLVDSSFHYDGLSKHLAAIEAPLGKFAVLGNHEFYAGVPHSLRFHSAAGFRVLRGESQLILPGLRIAGVDDPAAGSPGISISFGRNDGEAMILLKHRPDVDDAVDFDLQLSGHTHGGQLFPYSIIVKLINGRLSGLYTLSGGKLLYISRGTGYWGPPMRFLAPPEVTVITIEGE